MHRTQSVLWILCCALGGMLIHTSGTLAETVPAPYEVGPFLQKQSLSKLKTSWFTTWTLGCHTMVGTLKKKQRIQGFVGKKGSRVELYVLRKKGFRTGQRCPVPVARPACVQCDRCSYTCDGRWRHTYPIVAWSVRRIVLAHRRAFNGIWFKPGTELFFRANGSLIKAKLQKSQPLRAKKTGLSLPFPKGILIRFKKDVSRSPRNFPVPAYRLFNLGKFKCYYEDGALAVVCRF